jgi:hypothetical protein
MKKKLIEGRKEPGVELTTTQIDNWCLQQSRVEEEVLTHPSRH